jgi:hypothetical protein
MEEQTVRKWLGDRELTLVASLTDYFVLVQSRTAMAAAAPHSISSPLTENTRSTL